MNLVQLDHLSNSEISKLIESRGNVNISILMPVTLEPDKRDVNRITLKNLVQAAEEKLTLLNLRKPDIDRLLEPVKELVVGGRFLDSGSQGLAVYLSRDFARSYFLPIAPQESVTVGPDFLITPLMPLRLNEYFYVLAISQQETRLLRATQYSVERLDLGDMPASMAEALRWDDPERELQWHSQTNSRGERPAIFHGHGVGTKEIHKENLLRYFQMVDQYVCKVLTGENKPLVLAGVDYLLPIYREANGYRHLIKEGIEGSHQQLSDTILREQAWELVQPLFTQEREDAASLYYQQVGRELASADLATIIPAAHHGRIEILFVATDRQVWGRFDPENVQMELHAYAQPEDIDLLNLASIHTVMNNGVVYADRCEELPDEEALAAIFRY